MGPVSPVPKNVFALITDAIVGVNTPQEVSPNDGYEVVRRRFSIRLDDMADVSSL